jgi:preprotein translocase subunit SecE
VAEVKQARREPKAASDKRRPSGKRDVQHKSPKSRNPVIRYFQDTASELRKVAWPSRQQTLRLTLIVLGTMAVFTIFLGLLDLLFRQLAGLLV